MASLEGIPILDRRDTGFKGSSTAFTGHRIRNAEIRSLDSCYNQLSLYVVRYRGLWLSAVLNLEILQNEKL